MMIKDAGLRDSLLRSFPNITYEQNAEIEDEYMPHYVIYTQVKRGKYECYCTHCRHFYDDDRISGRTFSCVIKHNQQGLCLKCGHPITYLASGKGRKSIRNTRNFAIFKAVEDNLFIKCYKVFQRFSNDAIHGNFQDNVFDYDCWEKQIYCITKDGAQHWNRRFNFNNAENKWRGYWNPVKSENEPNFSSGEMYPDNSYTVIGEDEVSKTFLRYAEDCTKDASPEVFDVCNEYKISYLCEFANHPNVEYLMKTGFGYIVAEKLRDKNIHGVRVNYRSNDVKKMLKLNKDEMKLLANKNCEMLSEYLFLRKLDGSMSADERYGIIKRYGYKSSYILEIKNMTGLSLKKIVNYADKQRCYLSDWRDYLKQCRELQYDLSDTGITKPKNLADAHDRLTRIIKIKADEVKQKELEKRNKNLEKMAYIDEERGLQIIIPKSLQEIIDEGKTLDHCVGGYADRHADGKLTILFLRTIEKPNVPYYTMEVSTKGDIVQCRGYKNNCANNPKPQDIIDFEKDYQAFLDTLYKKKETKVRVSA